ncbi:TetR/AcrR family transcriptional regulator [Arthrobacter castelli]|uniref:TetR/AcrR family transcriptional regulator n=1 Tax=Arthrobacter castelli TaxID=271431 RepID=UPI00041F76A1|nr:TetR family transcriptional regulator C-terminal domain-containing protein [Arthrobacter castelli]
MPKVVDFDERREEIADALFNVVRRGGFDEVSLRSVAAEAALTIGSVRHFLGTRDELIGFAFDTMAERVQGRVLERTKELQSALDEDILSGDERIAALVELFCELLPLDEERKAEAIVWVEFEAAARTNHSLAERSSNISAGTTRLVKSVLAAAMRSGAFDKSLSVDVETARLAALVDGLTLRAVLHPGSIDPDTARAVLGTHLTSLRPRRCRPLDHSHS